MILLPKQYNSHLPSTWAAGVAIVLLGVGGYGATLPLLPKATDPPIVLDLGEEMAVEEFNAPAEAAPETPEQPPTPEEMQEELPEEIEIPEVPTIEAPLTPPEMTEITPLDAPPPPPPPVATPPKPKPPQPDRPKPPVRRAAPAPSNSGTGGQGSAASGSGSPTVFRGGSGRFPQPSYPYNARKAGVQGTVRLMVVVEMSGLPGSVSVQSSSGNSELDSAAQDTIRRRWRWAAGEVRRYIVPVRFVLR